MRILVAPDKFKDSLSAPEVCHFIKKGILNLLPYAEVIPHPLADGGEGSIEILDASLKLETVSLTVNDPLFRPIKAHYKKTRDTAFIQMSVASGIELLKPAERNCLYTSTYGTGELILHAIESGINKIFLFIGGSATNDAGIGMATALGYRFLDANDQEVKPIGKQLIEVQKIEPQALKVDFNKISVTVIADVDNVLFGPTGAAVVFAPQKGASLEAVKLLDNGLQHFSGVLQKDLKIDVSGMPGSGAAGGLGAGAVAFLGARIQAGCPTLMELTGFEEKVKNVDLIITGEGKLDHQTLHGKVVKSVADVCKKNAVPLAVICGQSNLTAKELQELGITQLSQLVSEEITVKQAMENPASLLEKRAYELLQAMHMS